MRTLSIDLETYSSVDLQTAGVYAYAQSPDFEIMLVGYAFDDDPVEVVDTRLGTWPIELIEALTDPQVLKTAFNAAFERTCLSAALGWKMPPEQWSCTAVMAAEIGLPRRLGAVGEVIGLPDDKQKSKAGEALIRYFCKPCKPTKVNDQRERNLPEDAPDKWAEFIEYNRQDVVAEREIRKKLSRFNIVPFEQQLWIRDQHINDRGVLVDLDFAKKAIAMDAQCKEELERQAMELTGLANPKSNVQLKAWIKETSGLDVESLNKKAIGDVRKQVDNDQVLEMLDLRTGLSRTSNAKYDKMCLTACRDGRIRGMSRFYGASRTGRWAGQFVQMQNLPQNKLPDRDLDIARALVKRGDYESFSILYDDVPGVLSQLIRTAFIPRPGTRFIVADFSAIEARVIAWLAGEQWRLDVFNTHGKIYEASAEQMFHLPTGSIKKGDPMRQKGKIAELALGFGGAAGALINMGALNMGLTESELMPLVKTWRAANPAIVKFWWDTDRAMKRAIKTGQDQILGHNIKFRKEGPVLRLRLPSGRELSYVKPAVINDQITYEGTNQTTGAWARIESYGPKVVENIVQATARDCLAVAIDRLESRGFQVVFHVHDEVICEVPMGTSSAKEVGDIMSEPIPWAVGMPLRADAYECNYYRKD